MSATGVPERTTPSKFAAAFQQALSQHATELSPHWGEGTKHQSYQIKSYTELFRETFLPTIAGKLGLEYYCCDYYTLDAIFYREKDTKNFGTSVTYAKSIEVAIEHENELRSAHLEINKLQLVNCPLKVLVVYTARDREREESLARFADMIHESDCFNDISTLRRQLLIYGNGEDIGDWRYFVYEQKKFVQMHISLA